MRGSRATDPYITFALHNLFHTAASICRFLDPSFFSEIDYYPLVKTACDVKITFKYTEVIISNVKLLFALCNADKLSLMTS